MEAEQKAIERKIRPAVRAVAEGLVAHGHEAYVVGGAVRDLLLGIEPKDHDFATSARPQDIRDAFGRRKTRLIGRRFRLAHVYMDRHCFEVSTFRREPTAEERRAREDDDGIMLWRDNVYGNLEQDARRRDFTVNALYYDPVGDRGIIDLVGGISDLRNGIVRAIGDARLRLQEDPVRMLRALKLVAHYGFTLEETLEAALHEMAPQIAKASPARLFEELLKILAQPYVLPTLQACNKYGLLQHFWPNLAELWGCPESSALLRALLRERDRRVKCGNYSTSKSLALATLALPAAARGMGAEGLPELWHHQAGLERMCRRAIRSFFEPLPVSRYFTARVRDIILLAPRLEKGHACKRVMRHPEYKYGRELFALLVEVRKWDAGLLEPWPPPPPSQGRRPRRETRRRKRRRKPAHGRARNRRSDNA